MARMPEDIPEKIKAEFYSGSEPEVVQAGWWAGNVAAPKTLGTLFASPFLACLSAINVSFSSSLLFSWLPWFYSPFHCSWTMQRSSVATD